MSECSGFSASSDGPARCCRSGHGASCSTDSTSPATTAGRKAACATPAASSTAGGKRNGNPMLVPALLWSLPLSAGDQRLVHIKFSMSLAWPADISTHTFKQGARGTSLTLQGAEHSEAPFLSSDQCSSLAAALRNVFTCAAGSVSARVSTCTCTHIMYQSVFPQRLSVECQ